MSIFLSWYLVKVYLKYTTGWLYSRFTIWNKYLIFWCVRNRLVWSANIIGSNMFEALFRLSSYKRNRSCRKMQPCRIPHLTVSKLAFFFIELNEWSLIWEVGLDSSTMLSVISYSSSLQCQKISIDQGIHQVYICYVQKVQLFEQLVILQSGQLNDSFGNQIILNLRYYFWSSVCINNYTLFLRVFWNRIGTQIMVYSFLCQYCPHPYKSEWPVL